MKLGSEFNSSLKINRPSAGCVDLCDVSIAEQTCIESISGDIRNNEYLSLWDVNRGETKGIGDGVKADRAGGQCVGFRYGREGESDCNKKDTHFGTRFHFVSDE